MKIIHKSIMYGAQGNEIPVVTSNLKKLKIGSFTLKNIPAQQITSNKPLITKNIHILGNEILKRFHIYFDFPNNCIYIKPNSLYKDTYVDYN